MDATPKHITVLYFISVKRLLDLLPKFTYTDVMVITKLIRGVQKDGSYDRYRIFRRYQAGNPGKKPSKLMNTMRNLDVGDAFCYPYPSVSCVYRSAKQLNITVEADAIDAGFLVVRVA